MSHDRWALSWLEDTQPDDAITPCYYESFIKGSQSDNTVFMMEVPTAFRDVDVEVNRTGTSEFSVCGIILLTLSDASIIRIRDEHLANYTATTPNISLWSGFGSATAMAATPCCAFLDIEPGVSSCHASTWFAERRAVSVLVFGVSCFCRSALQDSSVHTSICQIHYWMCSPKTQKTQFFEEMYGSSWLCAWNVFCTCVFCFFLRFFGFCCPIPAARSGNLTSLCLFACFALTCCSRWSPGDLLGHGLHAAIPKPDGLLHPESMTEAIHRVIEFKIFLADPGVEGLSHVGLNIAWLLLLSSGEFLLCDSLCETHLPHSTRWNWMPFSLRWRFCFVSWYGFQTGMRHHGWEDAVSLVEGSWWTPCPWWLRWRCARVLLYHVVRVRVNHKLPPSCSILQMDSHFFFVCTSACALVLAVQIFGFATSGNCSGRLIGQIRCSPTWPSKDSAVAVRDGGNRGGSWVNFMKETVDPRAKGNGATLPGDLRAKA